MSRDGDETAEGGQLEALMRALTEIHAHFFGSLSKTRGGGTVADIPPHVLDVLHGACAYSFDPARRVREVRGCAHREQNTLQVVRER